MHVSANVGEDRGAAIEALGSAAAAPSADRQEGVDAFLDAQEAVRTLSTALLDEWSPNEDVQRLDELLQKCMEPGITEPPSIRVLAEHLKAHAAKARAAAAEEAPPQEAA